MSIAEKNSQRNRGAASAVRRKPDAPPPLLDTKVNISTVANCPPGELVPLPARRAALPSLLGNIENYRHPPVEAVSERRKLLFSVQDTAASLTNSKYVSACLRVPLNPHGAVEVYRAPGGSVYFQGLFRCGLPWLCPNCASKISEMRRLDLERGVKHWVEGGGVVAMATKTLRHDASMSLSALLVALGAANNAFRGGKANKEFIERYVVSGDVSALEVTVGKNGWHVHIHDLMFQEGGGSIDYTGMESAGLSRWSSALARVGASCNERGYVITSGSRSAAMFQARYMSKYGRVPSGSWSLEQELCKSISKRAGGGNRSSLDLLIDAAAGDTVAADLFMEYAAAFKGKKQLRFKRGTLALLGMVESCDDALLARRGSGKLVELISSPDWVRLGYGWARVEVLEAVGQGEGVEHEQEKQAG